MTTGKVTITAPNGMHARPAGELVKLIRGLAPARVTLRNAADQVVTACEYGTGPIDAVYKAVNKIVQVDNELTEFSVQSVTRGIDALGEVTIRVTAPDGGVYTGRGADNDIIVSSTKAYLNALNRLLNDKQEHRR